MPPDSALARWRSAARLATEAEQAYFEASMAYAKGLGPMPGQETADNVQVLRQEASSLFETAMAEFEQQRKHQYQNMR